MNYADGVPVCRAHSDCFWYLELGRVVVSLVFLWGCCVVCSTLSDVGITEWTWYLLESESDLKNLGACNGCNGNYVWVFAEYRGDRQNTGLLFIWMVGSWYLGWTWNAPMVYINAEGIESTSNCGYCGWLVDWRTRIHCLTSREPQAYANLSNIRSFINVLDSTADYFGSNVFAFFGSLKITRRCLTIFQNRCSEKNLCGHENKAFPLSFLGSRIFVCKRTKVKSILLISWWAGEVKYRDLWLNVEVALRNKISETLRSVQHWKDHIIHLYP